nr:small capsid protein [Mastomys natalensis cytomegalovirus 3]WEG69884.1 small capsid protein [Mastomys natalensis cytomegalovirus 3]WEG70024.1 small capsid protein [Mastomys natalensis cytomegalovirus 3]WEG70164.1 small capsid protein [Mastomys natalensis cytomegalovirus 3]WEG70304.1 small capsid protein [Mastomys natalensis cytomegalovirus 3]
MSSNAPPVPASSGSGGSSGKKEEERKKQFVSSVLSLPSGVLSQPVVATMIPKYMKMTGHEDKAAFQLDLLRMLAVARISSVNQ